MGDIRDWVIEKVWRRIRRIFRLLWLLTLYGVDTAADIVAGYAAIIRREPELFLGVALFWIGLFGFEAGRFCDGNVVDHLSCTRPTTYYYFDWLDITLVVMGIFFLLFWHFKRQNSSRS